MQLKGLEDMVLASSIVSQCRISFPRSNGYSPNQWVLGQPEIRLPGSLLTDEESQRLEVLEAAEDPRSALAKSLGIREAARVAQIRLDTDSRVRRALLHQSTPTRGPYPVGSYVYFLRLQAPPGSQRTYKWFGPARVIGCELRAPARLADSDEMPTEGGQPRSYWLRYGSTVVLVTGEQLHFASEDELIAAHTIPQEALEPEYARGARNFVDLRGHFATPAQDQLQDDPEVQPHRAPMTAGVPEVAPLPMPQTPSEGYDASIAPDNQELPPVPEDDDDLMNDQQQHQPSDDHQPLVQQQQSPFPLQTQLEQQQPLQPHHNHLRLSSTLSRATVIEPEPQPQAQTPRPTQPPWNINQALQNPDRLDGHYGAQRSHHQHQYQQPYMVEDDDFDCETMPMSLKNKRLERLLAEEGLPMDFDEDSEESSSEQYMAHTSAGDVFLTGRAINSEVNLRDLSPEDRQKFDASMAKEWDSWQRFNAVEILSKEQIAKLPEDAEIIGTRWVHTDKNKKPRLMAEFLSKKTGKSKQQIAREFPFEAKSRMVVQGNQEDPTGIRTDSPTASLLAFNLVCAMATMFQWIISACDASTAYLQSHGISRLLLLRPPRPPPPGVSADDLMRALGSISGTKDAGRAWWKKLYKTLIALGWRMSKIEPALFLLVLDGRLFGVIITHVDDLFCAGEGQVYESSIEKMTTEIHLKVNKQKFRFCGKNVVQKDDFTIEIDQYDAIEGIDYMVLDKNRRKMINSSLTESEKTSIRALIGQMGWVTRQSRPDLMVNVSVASQSMGNPKVKDVVNLNKAVKMLKESAEAKWRFVPHDSLSLDNCIVFVFADSSFANGENLKSQCGYVLGLSTPEIRNGSEAPIMVLETYSGSVKRVCRSTLAAEANGFLTGVEAGDYVRSILLELKYPGKKLLDLDLHFQKAMMACFSDAKSLESTLNKDAGQPSDKRVRILVSQVKELIGENDYDESAEPFATWVDTSQMLADVLTKVGCEREPLLQALHSGRWKLEPSEEAKLKKVQIRAGRHARKAAKAKAAVTKVAEDGCEFIHGSHASLPPPP